MKDDDIMTATQAASFLGVSVKAIREMAEDRKMPGRRILSKEWRFSKQAILKWLAEIERES